MRIGAADYAERPRRARKLVCPHAGGAGNPGAGDIGPVIVIARIRREFVLESDWGYCLCHAEGAPSSDRSCASRWRRQRELKGPARVARKKVLPCALSPPKSLADY